MRSFRRLPAALGATCLGLAAVLATAPFAALGPGAASAEEEESEPAQNAIGERLFLETRFAQHFAARCGGDVNATDVPPDPVMRRTVTTDGSLPGAFAAASMNCRQCHLVDEHPRSRQGGALQIGVRAYADFARRSPVPDRGDGHAVTLRNSPSLVGSSRRAGIGFPFLHFDAEFGSAEDLVVGTFTGRNFGWLPEERDRAVRHIARVLREDDGRGELAREFGGAYRHVLSGTSQRVPAELRLPPSFRVDVDTASDERLVRAAARLVAAYLRSLDFARDERGRPTGSAYDRFLAKNDLPRAPRRGEAPAAYAQRLLRALDRLDAPRFVDGRDGGLAFHEHPFAFDAEALRGLRVFLRTAPEERAAGVGNCVTCHAPPEFTDHGFHDTGVSQDEYDRVHGAGAFAELAIPSLAERNEDPAAFLPPTASRPGGTGRFASIPSADAPERADLGVWNVLFDDARPRVQSALRGALAKQAGGSPPDEELLARAVGAFKTPRLRDLGQSDPYMHDGSLDSFLGVARFYQRVSDLARAGALRNGDPALADIRLDDDDVRALATFLRTLDQDYD